MQKTHIVVWLILAIVLGSALGMCGASFAQDMITCVPPANCDMTDGSPVGAMTSHDCYYSSLCMCQDGRLVGGWCRKEYCKACRGSSGILWQCEGANKAGCMIANQILCCGCCNG